MELQRLAFFGTLLLILGFCHYYDKSVEVNDLVECSECSLDNIESVEVLSGHQILISCKVDDEQFKTRGIGEVKDGKFKVAISNEIVDNNGQLREECFAQLKSISSDITFPSFDDELEVLKVVTQSIENGKHILGTKGKLDLSPNVCNSAFLVHYFLKHPIIKKRYKNTWHETCARVYVRLLKSIDFSWYEEVLEVRVQENLNLKEIEKERHKENL
ncbi:hypothetical protein Scep_021970 [Stephania cephalantha]|uniref:Uncharacterized protein n=1 Tax=Stephania cephalantha TaxID=152367 RepID=A0AAP0F4G0_9MAGN